MLEMLRTGTALSPISFRHNINEDNFGQMEDRSVPIVYGGH